MLKKKIKKVLEKWLRLIKRENDEIIIILKDEIKKGILKDFFGNNKNKNNNVNDDVKME
jgi:hypothetical protein